MRSGDDDVCPAVATVFSGKVMDNYGQMWTSVDISSKRIDSHSIIM